MNAALRATAILVALASAPAASAQVELLDAGVRFDAAWAQGFHGVGDEGYRPQKVELMVEPEAAVGLPRGLVARGVARLRFDLMDRLDPGQREALELAPMTRPVLIGSRGELELRELTLAGEAGPVYVSAGKQQIVWGIADGFHVLDVVDPFDFREFILPEPEDYRVPLWSLLLSTRLGPVDAELVWVPDTSVSVIPERDALFAVTSPLLAPQLDAPGSNVIVEPVRRPAGKPANWDYGLRLATLAAGWDLATIFLYRIDDQPVYSIENLGGNGGPPDILVTPSHLRTEQVGLTATKAFGNATARAEFSYVRGRGFLTESKAAVSSPGTRDGFARSDALEAVLGFDWFGFRDTFLSFQLHPVWIRDHRPDFFRDRFEVDVSLRAARSFRNETVELSIEWVHSLNRSDGLVRPQLAFQWTDRVLTWFSVDVFYGTPDGVFGQYRDLDRAMFGFRFLL